MKEKWRSVFLNMKVPEMKEDLLVCVLFDINYRNSLLILSWLQSMEGCIERWMDAKNYQITLLKEEREEFDDQSNYISQCHVAILDKLFGKL